MEEYNLETYYLDGEKYYYKDGKWLTSSYIEVPLAIVNELNNLLINTEEFTDKSMHELLEIIDSSRCADNIYLAAKVIKAALEIASIPGIRKLLPRLTSNYRRLGMPQKAIDIAKFYTDEYGKKVYSSALFTSVAAAFCDIGNYDKAKKFADLAKGYSAGDSSIELISVYKRIKSYNER